MAQGGKMPAAGTGAGACREEEAAPTVYGGIEADRLVVLAKPLPLPSGAGYYCAPFADVRFQDLSEELRRQIAAASSHAAGAGAGAAARPKDPNGAPVVLVAPLRGGGDAAPVRVDVVPGEGLGLRHQLPGLVSRPGDEPAFKFAGDGILRLMEDDGKVMACLDASSLQAQVLGGGDEMDGSHFSKEKVFPHGWYWTGHSGGAKYKVVANDSSEPSNMAAERAAHAYMGAVYDDGLPAVENAAPVVALLLGNNRIAGARVLDTCSDGLAAFPREDAVAFVETLLGNGRATEQGAYDNYDVLVPAAGEALRGPRSPAYAVQVLVDAAAGAKASDPIEAGGKAAVAAGANAGDEHGGSLSAMLGIIVASSAATALAAGTVGPATAFGLFAALLGGLSLAMASVRDW